MQYKTVQEIEEAGLPAVQRLHFLNVHMANISSSLFAMADQVQRTRDALVKAFAELQEAPADSGVVVPDVSLDIDKIPSPPPIPEDALYYSQEEQCDWVIEAGRATRVADGYEIAVGTEDPIAVLYRVHQTTHANHSNPFVVGVRGDGGLVRVCDGYNAEGTGVLAGEVNVHVVGLTEDAEIQTSLLGNKYGSAIHFGTYNIGTRGYNSDSFIMRQRGAVGRITRRGCWFLPYADGHIHTSGMVLSHPTGRVIWTDEQNKGTLLKEHLGYFKPVHGWFMNNNLLGGNRSGFMWRGHGEYTDPGKPTQPHTGQPEGPLVIGFNYCHRHGYDHNNANGGGVITVYCNPDYPTWIVGNTFTESRYGGIVLSDQAENRNILNENGFPIAEVYVRGNIVTGSDRWDFMASGVEKLFMDGNSFDKVAFNSDFSHKKGAGILNGEILTYEPFEASEWDFVNESWRSFEWTS